MLYKENIVAVEPIYVKGFGDATKIYLKNGETKVDKRKINTILKEMAKRELVDMTQVHQLIKKYLSIRKSIPFVFDKNYIYIGIKTRKPICKNDATLAFINLNEIKEYNNGILYLKNGAEIKVLDSKTLIRRKINNGILCGILIEDRKRFTQQ